MSTLFRNDSELDFYFESCSKEVYEFDFLQQTQSMSKKEKLKQKRDKQKELISGGVQQSTIPQMSKADIRKMKNRQAAQVSRDNKYKLFEQVKEENIQLKQLIKEKDEIIQFLRQENLQIQLQGQQNCPEFEFNSHQSTGLQKDYVFSEFEEQYSVAPEEVDYSTDQLQSLNQTRHSSSKKTITSLGVLGLFSILCFITMLQGPDTIQNNYLVEHHNLQTQQYINPQLQQFQSDNSNQKSLNIKQNALKLMNQQELYTIDDKGFGFDNDTQNSILPDQIQSHPLALINQSMNIEILENPIDQLQPKGIIVLNCKPKQCLQILYLMMNGNSSHFNYDEQNQLQKLDDTNQIIVYKLNQDQNQAYLQNVLCQIIKIYSIKTETFQSQIT